MALFQRCERCRKRKLWVAYRTFTHSSLGKQTLKSKDKLCGKCAKAVKAMLKT